MMEVGIQRDVRPPNWLPLPGERIGREEAVPHVDEDDVFPKGQVLTFYPRQGVGTLRSDRGQAFDFSLSNIDLIGPKGHPRYLAAGARVGFDVSWTSHGLKINRLKIY